MTFPPPCAMLEADKNRRRTDHVEHFWDTIETIGEGYGFSLFGPRHLATLALFVLTAALCCRAYRRADEKGRARQRKVFAALLLADELFKQVGLQIGGNFDASYLPLQLCSINIFLIALHAWRPSEALDNFLYYICIPAATAASSGIRFAPVRTSIFSLASETTFACSGPIWAPSSQ